MGSPPPQKASGSHAGALTIFDVMSIIRHVGVLLVHTYKKRHTLTHSPRPLAEDFGTVLRGKS